MTLLSLKNENKAWCETQRTEETDHEKEEDRTSEQDMGKKERKVTTRGSREENVVDKEAWTGFHTKDKYSRQVMSVDMKGDVRVFGWRLK